MTHERLNEIKALLETVSDPNALEIIVELCVELGNEMEVSEINTKLIMQLMERSAIRRKWARRWKELAKLCNAARLRNWRAAQTWKHRAIEKHNRMAALENAARSCETCANIPGPDDNPRETCYRAGCRVTGSKYRGWKFDVKRFEKGGAGDE